MPEADFDAVPPPLSVREAMGIDLGAGRAGEGGVEQRDGGEGEDVRGKGKTANPFPPSPSVSSLLTQLHLRSSPSSLNAFVHTCLLPHVASLSADTVGRGGVTRGTYMFCMDGSVYVCSHAVMCSRIRVYVNKCVDIALSPLTPRSRSVASCGASLLTWSDG